MKSANVTVRVEPDVKEKAEAILSELGIPTSTAINMFYRQIVLWNGLPFRPAKPPIRPLSRDEMTDEVFNARMAEGLAQAKANQTHRWRTYLPDCLGKSTMERQYDIHITPHAEQAMREIASYIAVDLQVPETAMQMLRTFQVEIAKLKMMPQRIPLTPEEPWHSVGIRQMLVKNYNIYFWIDDEKSIVQITDVLYGRRNQPKQLMDMPME